MSNSFIRDVFPKKIKKTEIEIQKELEGIPKNIGPYEIKRKIRDGGYSKVYQAISKYTGFEVVIKSIDKLYFQKNVDDLQLMCKQTEILRILKHRNILTLYETYESPKYFYFVLEYLDDNLIEKLVKHKRFNENDALKIFVQLVDALYYMHKMNICHRDIRTEHIMFDKNNRVKIIGFSFSSFYYKGRKLRDSFGSLCYACPEILQGLDYDPELADIWSLGVVLYVMVCGYLPFSEEDDEKNKNLIINGKIEFPQELSNKLKDLLRHMLDKNPFKRYRFQRIIRHPWFKPFSEEQLLGGVNVYEMSYPIDSKILNIVKIYGFNKLETEMDLRQNKYNQGTGVYRQIVRKIMDMGMRSPSDLCSDLYKQFLEDEDNFYKDGEKRYKKYFDLAQKKIQKIENNIDDYKSKEDRVKSDLAKMESYERKKKIEEDKKAKEKEKENKLKIKRESSKERNMIINKNNMRNNIRMTLKNPTQIRKLVSNALGVQPEKEDIWNKYQKDTIFEESYDGKNITKVSSSKNITDFVQKLLDKEEKAQVTPKLNEEKEEENEETYYNLRYRKRIASVDIKAKRRKNYLNTSSFVDNYLKKTHPENIRKVDIKNSILSDISHVVIEENANESRDEDSITNEDNKKTNNKNDNNCSNISKNNKSELKKDKSIRYSLSFRDDDEIDDEGESSYISKIDEKITSMMFDIEEFKELKEIRNTITSPAITFLEKKNSKVIQPNQPTPGNNIFNLLSGAKGNECKNKELNNFSINNDIEINNGNEGNNKKEKKVKSKNTILSELKRIDTLNNEGGVNEEVSQNLNTIYFEDNFKISFQEDNDNKSDIRGNSVENFYSNDKKTLKRLNINIYKDNSPKIYKIEMERKKRYSHYSNDKYSIRKINIINDFIDIDNIENHRNKTNEIEEISNEIKPEKKGKKKRNLKKFINIKKEDKIKSKNNGISNINTNLENGGITTEKIINYNPEPNNKTTKIIQLNSILEESEEKHMSNEKNKINKYEVDINDKQNLKTISSNINEKDKTNNSSDILIKDNDSLIMENCIKQLNFEAIDKNEHKDDSLIIQHENDFLCLNHINRKKSKSFIKDYSLSSNESKNNSKNNIIIINSNNNNNSLSFTSKTKSDDYGNENINRINEKPSINSTSLGKKKLRKENNTNYSLNKLSKNSKNNLIELKKNKLKEKIKKANDNCNKTFDLNNKEDKEVNIFSNYINNPLSFQNIDEITKQNKQTKRNSMKNKHDLLINSKGKNINKKSSTINLTRTRKQEKKDNNESFVRTKKIKNKNSSFDKKCKTIKKEEESLQGVKIGKKVPKRGKNISSSLICENKNKGNINRNNKNIIIGQLTDEKVKGNLTHSKIKEKKGKDFHFNFKSSKITPIKKDKKQGYNHILFSNFPEDYVSQFHKKKIVNNLLNFINQTNYKNSSINGEFKTECLDSDNKNNLIQSQVILFPKTSKIYYTHKKNNSLDFRDNFFNKNIEKASSLLSKNISSEKATNKKDKYNGCVIHRYSESQGNSLKNISNSRLDQEINLSIKENNMINGLNFI